MAEKTLPHTLLLTGGEETQRREKAYDLARHSIPAENLTDCLDFTEITNLDSPSIGIDAVRPLKDWASTKPLAQKKVVYIHNAELLTVEAQNSLLKLLEEPPAGCILILSTSKKSLLLPTVLSRCAQINLSDERDYTELKASTSDVVALMQGSLTDRFEWCASHQKLFKDEISLRQTIEEWLLVVRDLMLVCGGLDTVLTLPSVDDTQRVASLVSKPQCLTTLELLTEALDKMETTKVDRQLLFEVTLLSLPVPR